MSRKTLSAFLFIFVFAAGMLVAANSQADVTGRPHDLSLTNDKGHCINCHDLHQTKLGQGFDHNLKRANEIAVCYQCHAGAMNSYSSIDPSYPNYTNLYSQYDIRSEFNQTHIHFPKYGMDGEHNKCSYCHNPHGVFNSASTMRKPKLLSAGPDIVTDTDDYCLVCHNNDANPPHQPFPNISVGSQYRFSRTWYKQMRHSTFVRATTLTEPVPDTAHTYDDNPYGKGKDISCLTCHRPHGSPNDHMLKAPDNQDFCLSCHNGTKAPDLGSFNTSGHGKAGVGRICQECHFPHGTGQRHAVKRVIQDSHTLKNMTADVTGKGMNEACFACHKSAGTSNYYTGKSDYTAGIHNTSPNAHNPNDTTNDYLPGECVNCHDPHGRGYAKMAVDPNQTLCFDCHNTATHNTQSGKNVRAAFQQMSSSHDLTKVTCINCHNVHKATQTNSLMNPYSSAAYISDKKTFCLRCHSGRTPSGVTGAPDISAEWTGNGHDKTHILVCDDCHDSHGSPNKKTLNYMPKSYNGKTANFVRGLSFSSRALCEACHNRISLGYKDAKVIPTGSGYVTAHNQDDTTPCSNCHTLKHNPSIGSSYTTACLDCHKQGLGNPYPNPDTDFNTPTIPNDPDTYLSTHALTYNPPTTVDCTKCHGANHETDHSAANKITDPDPANGATNPMPDIRTSSVFCMECHDSTPVTLGGKTPPQVNYYVINSDGFESGLGAWVIAGAPSTIDTTVSHSGTASAKMVTTYSECYESYWNEWYDCTSPGNLEKYNVPVQPNTSYTISSYVNIPPGGSNSAQMWLTEYTSGGNYITTRWSPSVAAGSGWQLLSMTWTTASNTSSITLDLQEGGAGTVYWDDFQLVSNATPGGHDKDRVLVCWDCHEYHRSMNTKLLNYQPKSSGGYTSNFGTGLSFGTRSFCESCHNRSGLGYKNAKMIPTGTGYMAQHNQGDTTPCSTCHTDKHNPTIQSSFYTTSCLNCHKAGSGNPYPNADAEFNTPAIPNDANTRGSAHKINYAPPSTVDCTVCHGGNHEVSHSPTNKVIDPDPAHPTTKSLDISSSSAFCLQCHDATPVNIGGAVPPNIIDTYTSAGHGMSSVSGVICSDCHEHHGSYNKKLIKTTIRGAAVMPNYSGDNVSVCIACHKGTYQTIPYWPGYSVYSSSIHSFGNISTGHLVSDGLHGVGVCVNCHNPHGVRLNGKTTGSMLYKNEEDLCYRCHNGATPNTASGENVQARFQMTTHHKISDADQLGPDGIPGTADDSKVECSDCHDPHTITEKLMGFKNISDAGGSRVMPVVTDQDFCLKCHSSNPPQRVKFPQQGNWDKSLFDSSAHGNPLKRYKSFGNYSNGVKYACKVCHNPHGSNQAALQRESWDINRDGIPDDIDGDGILDSSDMVGFIGYSTGTRKAILVNTTAGIPSRASFRRVSTTIPKQGNGSIDIELCLNCHDGTPAYDVKTDMKKRSHHPVEYTQQVALGNARISCYNCHDQHRSQARNDAAGEYPTTNPKGQREPMPGDAAFCLKCHDNNPPDGVSFGNQVLKNIKLSYNPKDLRDAKGYDIITSYQGHYVQSSGAPMMCRDCHNQHGSDYSKMLRDNTEPSRPGYDPSQPIQNMQPLVLRQTDSFSGGDNLPVSSTAERCLACHSGGTTYKGRLIPLPPPPDAAERGFSMSAVGKHPDLNPAVTTLDEQNGHIYRSTFSVITTSGSVKDTCTLCHDSHNPFIKTIDGELTDCYRCHNQNTSLPDVQTEFNDNPTNPTRSKSIHPIKYDPTDKASTSVECLKCHDQTKHMQGAVRLRKDPSRFVNYTSDSGVWASPVANRTVNQFCLECHDPGTIKASSFFRGGVEHVPTKLPAGYAAGAHFVNGSLLCTDCHEYHGSKNNGMRKNAKGDEEAFCYTCHSNPANSMDGINIKGKFSKLSSASHHTVDAAEQAAMGSKVECENCHNPHSVTRTSPVVNASDNSTAIPADDTFCLGCHNSAGASGVKFPGYTTGKAGPEWDPNTGKWNKWDKSGYLSTAHKGNSVACERCHDPHGSKNYSLLLTNISSSTNISVRFGIHSTARGGKRTEEIGVNGVCGACHKASLGVYNGLASFTSSTWGKKNGIDKNCTYCHNPHSSQPMMIHSNKPLYMNMTSKNFGSAYNFKQNRGFANQTTGAPYYAFCSSRGCHASERSEVDTFNLDLPAGTYDGDATKSSHHPIKEGTIGCNSCHKEHGTSITPSDYLSPDLRATYVRQASWFKLGTAPGGKGISGGGGVATGGDGTNFFYQNTPNPITPPDNANNLCFMCHQKDDIIGTTATGMSGTNTKFLGHEAVKGGAYVSHNISPSNNPANSDYHNFSCSACHFPHSSYKEKLLQVGCMSQAGSVTYPSGSGSWLYQDSGGPDGNYDGPGGGGGGALYGCHAYKGWSGLGIKHGWRNLTTASKNDFVRPPNAVTDLSATIGLTDNNVTLNWHAVADAPVQGAHHYNVYRSSQTITQATKPLATRILSGLAGGSVGSAMTWTDTTTLSSATYYYIVVACDTEGNESFISNCVVAALGGDRWSPNAISGQQTFREDAKTTIKITWRDPGDTGDGITHYNVYRINGMTPLTAGDIKDSNLVATVADTGPNGASDTTLYNTVDATADVKQSYSYAVVALDGVGNASALPTGSTFSVSGDTTPPPAITTQQVARVSGSTSIKVTWNDPGDAGTYVAYYKVYRKAGTVPLTDADIISDNYLGQINDASWGKTSDGTTYSYTDSAVTVTQSYSYAVVSVDAAGNVSHMPTGVTFTVPGDNTAPPAITTQQVARVSGTTNISVTWRDPGDADTYVTSYKVYRKAGTTPLTDADIVSGNNLNTVNDTSWGKTSDGTTYSYTDLNPTVTQSYSYAVVSVDAAGNVSHVPTGVTFTVLGDVTAPPAITTQQITQPDASLNVILTWHDPGDADTYVASYKVYRMSGSTPMADGNITAPNYLATVNDTSWAKTADGNTYTYTDTTAQMGQSYAYAVVSIDAAGNISHVPTAVVLVYTVADPAPNPVTLTSAIPVTADSKVNLTWSAPADIGAISGYNIYRKSGSALIQSDLVPANMVAGPVSGSSYQAVVPGTGTNYYYSVTAIDQSSGKESKLGNSLSVNIPSPPSSFTATRQSNSVVNLSWLQPSYMTNFQNYKVYKRRNGGSWSTPTTVSATTTSINLLGLEPGTYDFGVTANYSTYSGVTPYESLMSTASLSIADTVAPATISSAAGAVTAASGYDRASINWTAPSDLTYAGYTPVGVDHYIVEANYSGTWVTLNSNYKPPGYNNPGTILVFNDSNTLTPGTSVTYRIQSVDASNNYSAKTTSSAISARPTAITSLNVAGSSTTSANILTFNASVSQAGLSRYYVYAKEQATQLTSVVGATQIGVIATLVPSETFVHDLQNAAMPAEVGHTYAYAVIAEDINGADSAVSSGSQTVNLVIDKDGPVKVTDLAVTTTIGTNQATLAWSTPLDNSGRGIGTGAVNYAIYRLPTSSTGTAIPVTDDNFGTASLLYVGSYSSSLAGTANTYNTTWYDHASAYYAVRSLDNNGNLSPISNSPFIVVGKDVQAPTPPVITACTPKASPEMDITWSPAVDNVCDTCGVSGYRLFRADVNIEPFLTDKCITENNIAQAQVAFNLIPYNYTAISDMGGAPGTTYYYALRAWDYENNLSNISNCAIATVATTSVDTTAPTWTGSALSLTQQPYPDLDLNWTPATDRDNSSNPGTVDHYDIYRSLTSFASITDPGVTKIATVSGIRNSYIDRSGAHSTTYYYGIVAVDASTNHNISVLSNIGYATVAVAPSPDNTKPTVPGTLAAATGVYPYINLSWTASTDLDDASNPQALLYYKLYRADYPADITDANKNNPSLVKTFIIAHDAVAYAATGSGSAMYNYRLEAFDLAENSSGLSNEVAGTVASAPCVDMTPPSAPAGLAALVGPSPDMALSWTASTDSGCTVSVIDHYNLYKATYEINASTDLRTITPISVAGNNGTYTDSTGAPNTTYWYVLTAVDPSGNESAKSNIITMTTAADTMAPAAITDLKASPSAGQAQLTWCKPSDNVGVNHYDIYRKEQGTILTDADIITGNKITTFTNAGTCLSYNDTPLTSGHTYSYAVIAVDGAGNRSTISRGQATGDTVATLP